MDSMVHQIQGPTRNRAVWAFLGPKGTISESFRVLSLLKILSPSCSNRRAHGAGNAPRTREQEVSEHLPLPGRSSETMPTPAASRRIVARVTRRPWDASPPDATNMSPGEQQVKASEAMRLGSRCPGSATSRSHPSGASQTHAKHMGRVGGGSTDHH